MLNRLLFLRQTANAAGARPLSVSGWMVGFAASEERILIDAQMHGFVHDPGFPITLGSTCSSHRTAGSFLSGGVQQVWRSNSEIPLIPPRGYHHTIPQVAMQPQRGRNFGTGAAEMLRNRRHLMGLDPRRYTGNAERGNRVVFLIEDWNTDASNTRLHFFVVNTIAPAPHALQSPHELLARTDRFRS